MIKVELAPAAERDLEDIFTYTLLQFGLDQAEIYNTKLIAAVRNLAENPLAGREMHILGQGIRRMVRESHSIYYLVSPDHVLVVRVLGPGQDPIRELK